MNQSNFHFNQHFCKPMKV